METNKLSDELRRLLTNCHIKREVLLRSALKRSRFKRRLTILSGVLALISAGGITLVLLKHFGNDAVQIISAILALFSGIISLFITNSYTVEDTGNIFDGSSKYFNLSTKVHRTLLTPNLTSEMLYEKVVELQDEYATLNGAYAKYDIIRARARDFSPSTGSEYLSSFSGYGYGTMAASHTSNEVIGIDGIPEHLKRYKNLVKEVEGDLRQLQRELDMLSSKDDS